MKFSKGQLEVIRTIIMNEFTYVIHGGHQSIKITDKAEAYDIGKLSPTRCYVCDILQRTRSNIYRELEKLQLNTKSRTNGSK